MFTSFCARSIHYFARLMLRNVRIHAYYLFSSLPIVLLIVARLYLTYLSALISISIFLLFLPFFHMFLLDIHILITILLESCIAS
ncbi:hypothetical protein I7I50_00586 [Histoplasma capsulatum G186AR]|uniref:Uncharacterized protein n=1 Tax=Ajellomyces capsulatus TaxID=5037 RepID=A0A8H7YE58_AJECA|nr:hypothetical protein I7I52_07854 [Histoplasma capsulatum]QSS72667.1 hypothetical protein I7I50_00586 [Histoplasma capsulatum G186AR]